MIENVRECVRFGHFEGILFCQLQHYSMYVGYGTFLRFQTI